MALYEGWEWFFFFTSIRTFLSFRDGSYYSLRWAINFKRICPTHICQRHPPTGGPRIILIIPLVTYIASQLSVPWSLRLPTSQSSTLQKQKPQTNIHTYKSKNTTFWSPPNKYRVSQMRVRILLKAKNPNQNWVLWGHEHDLRALILLSQ